MLLASRTDLQAPLEVADEVVVLLLANGQRALRGGKKGQREACFLIVSDQSASWSLFYVFCRRICVSA